MTSEGKTIILIVPPEHDYLTAIRAIVAATAAHAGLPISACDRARTAAHEAAGLLLSHEIDGSITCSITEMEEQIEVQITGNAPELVETPTDVAWVLLRNASNSLTVNYTAPVSQISFSIDTSTAA